MHDVVQEGGALQISAVDVHSLVELLHVGGLLQLQRVKVGLGQVDDATHQSAVL